MCHLWCCCVCKVGASLVWCVMAGYERGIDASGCNLRDVEP